MRLRDYTYLGTTQSLCPACLALVPAKIIDRRGRIYFQKRCPQHGEREDFVCSDARWFDRREFLTPGKVPPRMGVEPARGCPFDCGLCTEHEQHTCLGVLEITGSCNLECPLCYASSGPRGNHLTYDECCRAIDHLVRAEGRPEVLQLSGGEPTMHPEFLEIFQYACAQPIDIVMINTNGVRLARDPTFRAAVAEFRHRTEIYLQFDGFQESTYRVLRGEPLIETKLRAIEALGAAGLRVILVCTVEAGVNDHEIGAIVRFAHERPWITGVSFQPATYFGRCLVPQDLERRITFPDVIRAIAEQSGDVWQESDFSPLPCAHPNAHSLAYAYRAGSSVVPLARFIKLSDNLDLLSGSIIFNRRRARELVTQLISRQCCGGGDCGNGNGVVHDVVPLTSKRDAGQAAISPGAELTRTADEFFRRVLAEEVSPADVLRITTTSFMDAYNFDVRQEMKSCVHFVLPSGHIIPFSAYNLLYRDGHVPLPTLRREFLSGELEPSENVFSSTGP